MQPTFLGWCGYFAMVDACDQFILWDVVDVNLKSWQMRNRIRGRDGNTIWLSIPTNAKRGMPIYQVKTAQNGWQTKHWRTIQAAYSHTPHWDDLREILEPRYQQTATHLSDWTATLTRDIAGYLGTPSHRITSVYHDYPWRADQTDRIGRIADTLRNAAATTFLATPGSTFLHEHETIAGIPIEWFNYNHPEYTQGTMPPQTHLSIIDLIAYHGPKALSIIRSGAYATKCETSAESATKL